ncbi:MAG: TonB-dependent receptor [Chryseolinea sp.]
MLITLVFRLSGIGLCVLASLSVGAQQRKDSVTQLHEVIVEQSRLGNYAISKYTLRVDSMTRALASSGSLADMLRKYGYGHVRGYGPGGLATASFRGTGSSHTSVLWNGINLLSPLSGQLDLSLVPIGFIDDASIQTGGTTSLYGNGSIGGTILLNSKAHFNEGLTLKTFASVGSFGSYYQDAAITWSGKKFISSTKFFTNQSENDFKLTNTNTSQKERRDHSATKQYGILQQHYWQPAENHLLTFKLWWQDNTYEVPNPTTVPKKAEAIEQNTFWRVLGGWSYSRQNFELNYQGAFINHDLAYHPSKNLVSLSTFNTLINNLEGNFILKKNINLSSGINYTWEQGKVEEFGKDVPIRNRIAFFSALKWKPFTQWEFALAVREELVNGEAAPFAPSVTIKTILMEGLQVYGTLSRNYRLATFNDLYWKGGDATGNPELKSELSNSGEVGLKFSKSNPQNTKSILLSTAVFSNDVDNWILWYQDIVWSPQNIKKVWSRGVEVQGAGHFALGSMSIELSAQYSFTLATNKSIYTRANANEINKQLPYTPFHELSLTARCIYKGFYLNVVNSLTGKQYTTTDNDEFYSLEAFDLTNISLSKPLHFKTLYITLNGEINNVFDIEYLYRPGYPMPGINFKTGVTINFNKPNSL